MRARAAWAALKERHYRGLRRAGASIRWPTMAPCRSSFFVAGKFLGFMAVILCAGYLNEGAFALPIGIGHQEKGEFVNMRVVENVIIRDFDNEHCCGDAGGSISWNWEGRCCAPYGYGFIITCFEDKSLVEKSLPFWRNWRGYLGRDSWIDIRLGYNPVDYCWRSSVISESIFNLWDDNWKFGWDFRGIQENIWSFQFGKSSFGYICGYLSGFCGVFCNILCPKQKPNLESGDNNKHSTEYSEPKREESNSVIRSVAPNYPHHLPKGFFVLIVFGFLFGIVIGGLVCLILWWLV